MDTQRAARLVETALRCYPARWQQRHGEEATELAALLIRDGAPAGSIARNYLAGAAREWLTLRHSRRLGVAVCALLAMACSLGISAGLLAPTAPARAASTSPPHAHAHCRAGSREPGQSVSRATSTPRVRISEGWHGRSC